MHRACDVVLFLFYIRTIDIGARNRVKNGQNLELTTFTKINSVGLAPTNHITSCNYKARQWEHK